MRHVCVSVKFVSPSVVVTRLQASDSKKPPSQEQEQYIPRQRWQGRNSIRLLCSLSPPGAALLSGH